MPLTTTTTGNGVLYVAALGGLFKSADGGTTWAETGLKQAGLRALVYDPRNLSLMYAMNDQSFFKSTDGSRTWTPLVTDLPAGSNLKLALDPSNANQLYVWRYLESGVSAVFRSTNGGQQWTQIFGAHGGVSERNVRSLTLDPRDGTIYIGTYRGLYKSTDAGQTVQAAGLADNDIFHVTVDPANAGTLYASTAGICCAGTPTVPLGGIAKTTDGGKNWVRLNNSLKDKLVTAISVDPNNSANVYAATPAAAAAARIAYAVQLSVTGLPLAFSFPFASGEGRKLARDAAENLYVLGSGTPFSLPNAWRTEFAASFALKFNPRTQAIDYATYLPLSPVDSAVDRANTMLIVGNGSSGTEPLVKNGYQATVRGGQDSFVCRLDPQRAGAASLLYGSFVGGAQADFALAIKTDGTGAAYVLGRSDSSDFPLTANSFNSTGNVFLYKLDPAISGAASLSWSARAYDGVTGLLVDADGNSYFYGSAKRGLPVTPGALQTSFTGGNCPVFTCACPLEMGACPARCGYNTVPGDCADGFVSKVSADGTTLLYSTYLGTDVPSKHETVQTGVLDSSNNLYLLGEHNLPVTPGALNTLNGVPLAKLNLEARSITVAAVSAASFLGIELAPASLVAAFLQSSDPIASTLTVTVMDTTGTDRSAKVLYTGPGQINFEVPADTAAGAASVKVRSAGAVIASGAIHIAAVTPGIFAANGNGRGIAAALIVRVKDDGTQVYDYVSRYDAALKQHAPLPIDLGPANERVFLVLFGTGWRNVAGRNRSQLRVGGAEAQVTYDGLQPTLIGVDQINALLPRTLSGRGEVDVALTVDGKPANVLRLAFK